ncbi:class I SAM-dependent methyltransferase [Nucisporomicrobium flavum]|uniref:class I SAM-dependent methyltransferase n=1 Tax=Nucisporomicrobium flavum TaxID=2785915 RepID=UPI003C2AB4E6
MAHSHLAEMLDLDAEVLQEYHRDVITWAGSLVPARPRIIDLGAGTGTGSLALARHLPDAEVTAVDVDDEMLEHLRHRADELGLGDRVRTVQADLDQPWPDLGPADLVWASASLHHMADPGNALAQALATLRPGGVMLATELDSFPLFLTGTADAGLEERAHAALAALRDEAGLHMHEDWGDRLAKAGFAVEEERRADIDLRPPLPPAAGRYAQVSLGRMAPRLEGRLDPADLAALEALAAGVADRDDLTVRTTRTVWLGRRPVA